jgi:hypothetical protein
MDEWSPFTVCNVYVKIKSNGQAAQAPKRDKPNETKSREELY